jgi:hypothetical protein
MQCCRFVEGLDLVLRVRSKQIFKTKGVAYFYCLGVVGSVNADVQLIFRFAPENKNTEEHDRLSEHISVPQTYRGKYDEVLARPAAPEIRTGDVLKVTKGFTVKHGDERCPAGNFLKGREITRQVEMFVLEWEVVEAWEDSFGNTLVKSRSGKQNPQSRCLIFHPPLAISDPMPIAIVQVSAALTERLQAFLGGSTVVHMASTLTKDRCATHHSRTPSCMHVAILKLTDSRTI